MLIGLYPRVSTTEQAENGNSLQEQIDRMKKYCEAMGWTVYRIYTDAGYSGGNKNRPGLQAMIRDVEAGRLDKVLVYKLDRLSRSQKDTLELIEDVFLSNNTEFVSMSENFDTSTPLGRAMIGILAVFAQLEREQIKERMVMGKEAIVKQGKFAGGRHIPIGYIYKDGDYVVDEFEKMQVIDIFNMAASGLTPYGIAKVLNEKGFVQKNGPWRDQNVRRVLEAKTYIGYKKYRNEWYKSTHEPIIDEELFYKVQKIRTDKRLEHLTYNRRAGLATSFLGGYLYCAHCGAKYAKNTTSYKKKDGSRAFYTKFSCNSRAGRNARLIKDPNCKNKHWKVDELTETVFAEIRKLAIDPQYIAKIKDETPENERISTIGKEIKKLDEQVERIMDLYTIGQMPVNILQDRVTAINDQKLKLEDELATIKKENEEKLSQEETFELVQSFSEILDRDNFEEIRAAVGSLIRKVVIDNEDITIHWAFA